MFSTSPKEIHCQTVRDYLYLLSLIIILFIILLVVIHLDGILNSKFGQVKLPNDRQGIFLNYLVIKLRLLFSQWMANTIHLFLPQINRLIRNSNLTKSERRKKTEPEEKRDSSERGRGRLCKRPKDSLSPFEFATI